MFLIFRRLLTPIAATSSSPPITAWRWAHAAKDLVVEDAGEPEDDEGSRESELQVVFFCPKKKNRAQLF